MEEQSFEVRDAGGFYNLVFYNDGIARYPSLFGIYMGIWMIGCVILFVVLAVISHLTGFAMFSPSGAYTLLGGTSYLLNIFLPLLPVAFLELRRRQRGGTQPIEKAVASGFVKLIPWTDVVRLELKPVRFNTRRWTITVMTSSKTYKGRISQIGTMQDFLRLKAGDKLKVLA